MTYFAWNATAAGYSDLSMRLSTKGMKKKKKKKRRAPLPLGDSKRFNSEGKKRASDGRKPNESETGCA